MATTPFRNPTPYDAVIIGGGINGLSAAYHLQARGCRRLAVVERYAIGHGRGSSHGPSRVIRSTYPDPFWVALARDARAEAWPALEADLGRQLIHPHPTYFFGPADGDIADYAAAVEGAGADVVALSPRDARRACPSLRFGDDDLVLHDRSGGFIAAVETIGGLAARLVAGGADLIEHSRVHAITPGATPLAVATDRGILHTERLVIAAGAWTGALLPWLAPRLTVLRQTVGYFGLDGDAAALPVWARIGRAGEPFVYGLPAFGRPGFKAAVHRTAGPADDPDADLRLPPDSPRPLDALLPLAPLLPPDPPLPPDPILPPEIADLRALVARFLPVTDVESTETCLYTMIAGGAFVLDMHPEDPRIVIAACCSGHAFKFGPLIGRIAADLALEGRSTVSGYADHSGRFAAL